MLEKLERVYLGALRIIILITATLALLAAIGGLASLVPTVIQWSGLGASEAPTGGTLGQFISEQKITETSASTADGETGTSEPVTYSDISQAARDIDTYLGKRGSISREEWASSLQRQALNMDDQGFAYAADVRRLTGQLLKSKGKPLSEDKLFELLNWHSERFKQNLASLRASDAEASAVFWIKLGTAGAAFLAFISIIFIFLFVKIERNLRVVQTVNLSGSERRDEDA